MNHAQGSAEEAAAPARVYALTVRRVVAREKYVIRGGAAAHAPRRTKRQGSTPLSEGSGRGVEGDGERKQLVVARAAAGMAMAGNRIEWGR